MIVDEEKKNNKLITFVFVVRKCSMNVPTLHVPQEIVPKEDRLATFCGKT